MLQNRPPIVVILGHVDHGKTSLLDFLRKSNIASREAGGITQHIRSFQLHSKHGLITFIDTPGHAAFAAMRDRGSKVADVAILVVAGNDGVMPQTKESIQFIKHAGIPFIVAVTKSDLPTFDPDRVKTQLTESEIVVEDFGGDVPVIPVSAKTGAGIPDLLDMIQLVSSLNQPQGDTEASLEMLVLESHLDSQKGPVAVCIVKNGQLKYGSSLFQAECIGKVRAIIDSEGKNIKSADPSSPLEVLGLTIVPSVGSTISDKVHVTSSSTTPAIPSTSTSDSVNIVIKADVAGSLEAILSSLPKEINVLSSGTGEVTETDISQASVSKAVVISFGSRVSTGVAKLAEVEKVTLRQFKIIYELLEYATKLLTPLTVEKVLGKATILAEFKIDSDRIAGCKCVEGVIFKSAQVKVVRGDVVIGTARIKSLRLGKTESSQVKSPAEFGLLLSPHLDFKISDSIISFETHDSP